MIAQPHTIDADQSTSGNGFQPVSSAQPPTNPQGGRLPAAHHATPDAQSPRPSGERAGSAPADPGEGSPTCIQTATLDAGALPVCGHSSGSPSPDLTTSPSHDLPPDVDKGALIAALLTTSDDFLTIARDFDLPVVTICAWMLSEEARAIFDLIEQASKLRARIQAAEQLPWVVNRLSAILMNCTLDTPRDRLTAQRAANALSRHACQSSRRAVPVRQSTESALSERLAPSLEHKNESPGIPIPGCPTPPPRSPDPTHSDALSCHPDGSRRRSNQRPGWTGWKPRGVYTLCASRVARQKRRSVVSSGCAIS